MYPLLPPSFMSTIPSPSSFILRPVASVGDIKKTLNLCSEIYILYYHQVSFQPRLPLLFLFLLRAVAVVKKKEAKPVSWDISFTTTKFHSSYSFASLSEASWQYRLKTVWVSLLSTDTKLSLTKWRPTELDVSRGPVLTMQDRNLTHFDTLKTFVPR